MITSTVIQKSRDIGTTLSEEIFSSCEVTAGGAETEWFCFSNSYKMVEDMSGGMDTCPN
jgi:hypothetical protein